MVSSTSSSDTPHRVAAHFLRLAQQAARQGDFVAAEQLCTNVLSLDPSLHAAACFLISRALDAGNALQARDLAQRSLEQSQHAQVHFLHGRALEALGERQLARGAFADAYALDGGLFMALLGQGEQEEALGMSDACLFTYHRALDVAQELGALGSNRLPTAARRSIEHAVAVVHAARVTTVQDAMAPMRMRHGDAAVARIDRALDILLGDSGLEWIHPLQRPTFMLIPGLEPKPWFERDEFPFLAEIERHTGAIVEELRAVLADEAGLSPYVDMPADAPAAPVWKELNRSTRWSSYHLFRHGERIDAHCQRCSRTAAALGSIPLMRIPEHSPEALFSLLKAGTHIPSHTGVMNGRLTVHLPLIVPPDCGALKAGDEARTWVAGQCLIFDDSFAHEAWNDSDQDRAVLIFDIWDPRLNEAEREAVAAVITAIGRFNRAYSNTDATLEAH